ncbi:hypothetical protein D3C83_200700 [compost metagenome]
MQGPRFGKVKMLFEESGKQVLQASYHAKKNSRQEGDQRGGNKQERKASDFHFGFQAMKYA